MIQLMIRDLRAIERADVEIGPLTLVAGLNGVGKTTILEGMGRTLTGNPLPPWLNKSQAGALVRTGAQKGGVKVASPQGEAVLAYPAAQISQKGTQIRCSPIAAGLLNVVEMDSKKRTAALADLLGANPTFDDLANALRDQGVNEPTIKKAWEKIERDGWDAVYKLAATHGTQQKGAWQEVTKQPWGSKIGGTWTPDAWTPDADLAALERAAADARTAVEQAIAATATDAAEAQRLRGLAGLVEERKIALQYAVAQQAEAEKLLRGAQEQRENLPADPAEPHKCPECSTALAIEKGAIVRAKARSAAETKKLRDQRATLDGRIVNLTNSLEDKKAAVLSARTAFDEAQAAKVQIGEWTDAPAAGQPADLGDLRQQEQAANKRFDAAKRKADADRIHGQIVANQILIDAFAPDGVRGRVVRRAVDRFNEQFLQPFCEAAKWRPVQVSETLDFTYGGRPYEALAESEQMRVRIAVQVGAALLDGSELLIIDRADTLDQQGRGGLIGGLKAVWAGKPSLIGMTYSDRQFLPPLERVGGRVYWVADGQIERVGGADKAAA